MRIHDFRVAATEAICAHSLTLSETANVTVRGLEVQPPMYGAPKGHILIREAAHGPDVATEK